MSPKTKTHIFFVAMVVLITTLSCATVTNILDFGSTPDGEASAPPPAVNTITPLTDTEQTSFPTATSAANEGIDTPASDDLDGDECKDCDEFEFDENNRPILSGEALLQDTQHFRIHYTLSGRDAVASTAYVDEVAQAMEYSWQIEIDQFGWTPPPPDGDIGGDERYDVYLQDVLWDGTFGYTDGGDERYRGLNQTGDNPNSAAVETRAAASYIVLDNDYIDQDEWIDASFSALDAMRSTAAHEFNHAIQFGYDSEEPADWLWEATATWMQDEVYDDLNDADEELLSVFKSPDTCQLAYGGEERVEDENHWYGEWIFLRYISEHYGHETVRAIWEHARVLDGYAALEAALSETSVTLDDTFRGFAVALLTRDFEEGAGYPTVRLEGEASRESGFVPNDGVAQMAADYVEIQADGTVTLTLNADSLERMIVGVQGNEASIFPSDGNQATVDADLFDHLYLIVLNLEHADDEFDCEFTTYSANIVPASQSAHLPIPNTYPAPNFQPPEVEPLLDPEEYWGENWDEGNYEEVEPPAELIPGYMPEGYEFIEAYVMEAEEYAYEYDVDLIWYIPGEGRATVLDFYGPGEDDYIDITASESPYNTLETWLDAADYTPYDDELVTINDVSALLEDWANEYDPYSIATFITGGQFIVVEGNISTDEMIKVIESLPVLP